jgi:hypothetical protein
MTEPGLPRRRLRIPDATAAEVVRLDLRSVPRAEISRRLGLHRNTVARVLERAKALRQVNHDTEAERARAVAVYLEVQRSAWESVENALKLGRSPAMALAEVRQAQHRIDSLLQLEPAKVDDPAAQLALFKTTVVQLILSHAPDLAPTLSQALTEAAAGPPLLSHRETLT